MKLSAILSRYFEAWVRQESWDSGHPSDTANFYMFVKAVARYRRRYKRAPSQGEIHALLVQRKKSGQVDAEMNGTADYFADLYQVLLKYEEARFPDVLIERTNIAKCYLALTGDRQDIERQMIHDWGRDWKTKLHNG